MTDERDPPPLDQSWRDSSPLRRWSCPQSVCGSPGRTVAATSRRGWSSSALPFRWPCAATADGDGRTLTIIPADPSHALESLTVTIKGASPIEVGSDGKLSASDVAGALKDREKEDKGIAYTVPVADPGALRRERRRASRRRQLHPAIQMGRRRLVRRTLAPPARAQPGLTLLSTFRFRSSRPDRRCGCGSPRPGSAPATP